MAQESGSTMQAPAPVSRHGGLAPALRSGSPAPFTRCSGRQQRAAMRARLATHCAASTSRPVVSTAAFLASGCESLVEYCVAHLL